MKVEDVLSCKARMKILKILNELGELNVSKIASKLKLNHSVTSKHLKVLEEEGILKQKSFGRTRLYSLNERSPKAKAIKNLIEVWEQTNKHKPKVN
ncbi:MAG: winged helix-turn-helix domain-containing protein [Candidatus Bathyarchaeia archaeon]